MVNKDRFVTLTDSVIKNFEGGYYHPNMLAKGIIKDQRYAASGETMFGLDRKHGASLAKDPAWGKFWSLIDNANAKNLWKWNFMGGALADQLRNLAGQIMYPHFMRLFNTYLTPDAQRVVAADQRLITHFSYASWNGEGWFKKFAAPLNDAVRKGVKDPEQLFKTAMVARTNASSSLIRQHGAKMMSLFKGLSAGGAAEKKKIRDVFNRDSWYRSGASLLFND